MTKNLKLIVGLLLALCLVFSLAVTAFAGTSIPSSSNKKDGSYNGTLSSLGETPVYYSNYNVKPSSSTMSMWVTGTMNASGATSDYRSGIGLMSKTAELGSTKLYNFSDVSRSRNANYDYSCSTSNYYWSSFNLVNRNMYAQLVGSFTFRSN